MVCNTGYKTYDIGLVT